MPKKEARPQFIISRLLEPG